MPHTPKPYTLHVHSSPWDLAEYLLWRRSLSQVASDLAAGRVPVAVLCRGAGLQGWAASRIATSLKSAPSSGLHRAWRQAQQARHDALWKKTSVWDSLQRIVQQVLHTKTSLTGYLTLTRLMYCIDRTV